MTFCFLSIFSRFAAQTGFLKCIRFCAGDNSLKALQYNNYEGRLKEIFDVFGRICFLQNRIPFGRRCGREVRILRVFDKIIQTLFYDNLNREEFYQVRDTVAEANRRSGEAWSCIAGIFWVFCLCMSIRDPAFAACRQVYASALLACAATFFGMRFSVRRFPWTLAPFMYLFQLSFLFASIGIAVCQPNVRSVTMVAAAIIFPIFFIDRTIVSCILCVIAITVYTAAGKNIVAPEIHTFNLLVLHIFTIAGILVGHVTNKARYERYVYADSAAKLAEMQTKFAYYDQMTGLKNRRAFSEELLRLSEDLPPDLCVVMADVNGLKKVNDTFGHEAGDDLIIGASFCLSQAFGEIDRIYRIGGDEFCVILEGAENALLCLEKLEELTANWSGQCFTGLSLSCGLASTRDYADLDAIVREADERMYESKRAHYEAVS